MNCNSVNSTSCHFNPTSCEMWTNQIRIHIHELKGTQFSNSQFHSTLVSTRDCVGAEFLSDTEVVCILTILQTQVTLACRSPPKTRMSRMLLSSQHLIKWPVECNISLGLFSLCNIGLYLQGIVVKLLSLLVSFV